MNVFVAGATGMVGRPALAALVAAGHDVTAVARSQAKAELVRSLGATPVAVNLFDADAVKRAVVGHDVVINLATHIPPVTKMMLPSAWDENNRIRTEVSRHLVDAALAAGAQRYIQESIAFIYRDGGSAWLDEDAPVDLLPYVTSVSEAEGNAQRFTEQGGIGIVLRFGMFHGAQSEQTQMALRMALTGGVSMMFGAPDAYIPFVHIDDAGTAVAAAVAAPAGVYNVVDNEPVTRREYAAAMAAAIGKRRVRLMPRAATKLGGSKSDMLARSERVSNRRFRDATGWSPRYPSAREALAAIGRETPAVPADRNITIARVLLAAIAATSLMLGAWALLSPHGFYDSFPGGGRHWVSVDGPYNEHLVRDFAAFNLAFALMAAWAAARFNGTVARVVAAGSLVFALPHFAYHLGHLDVLARASDKTGNVVSLGLGVLAPIAVLVLAQPGAHEGREGAGGR